MSAQDAYLRDMLIAAYRRVENAIGSTPVSEEDLLDPEGAHLPLGEDTGLFLEMRTARVGSHNEIIIAGIEARVPSGSGIGSRAIHEIRSFAAEHGMDVVAADVTNHAFWERYGDLKFVHSGDFGDYYKLPRLMPDTSNDHTIPLP